MLDPNMRDFYQRVGRIERIHQNGGGFEAVGTLGMSYYNSLNAPRRRGNWVMPATLVLATIIGIKAAVLANVGPTNYADRIAILENGDAADRIGAYVLQADPLTSLVASSLGGFAR
jgi:hypothetical protein